MKQLRQDQILAWYEAVSAASVNMLEAAQRNDWDSLVAAERCCAGVIAQMQAAGDVSMLLDEEGSRRRHQLILHMLANDAAIRNLTQPWLRQLEQHLGAARAQRSLSAAYVSEPRV
jgi:flagellar protein FliT